MSTDRNPSHSVSPTSGHSPATSSRASRVERAKRGAELPLDASKTVPMLDAGLVRPKRARLQGQLWDDAEEALRADLETNAGNHSASHEADIPSFADDAASLTGTQAGAEPVLLAQAGSAAAVGGAAAPAAAPGVNLATLFGGVAVAGLVAGGAGGRSSAGVAKQPTPIELINGYIKNAQVWQDNDRDGVMDANEPQGTTDAAGKVELVIDANGGPLRSQGGVYTRSDGKEEAVTNSFMSPAGSTVITPLTTLVAAAMAADPIKTLGAALGDVTKALGIEGADLLTLDPVESALKGGEQSAFALKVKAVATSVSNLMDMGESLLTGAGKTGETSLDIASALVARINQGGSVNLGDTNTIKAVLNTAVQSLPEGKREAATGATEAIAMVAASTHVMMTDAAKSGNAQQALSVIAAVQMVAQGDASANLQKVAAGELSAQAMVSSFTGDSLAKRASDAAGLLEIAPGMQAKKVEVLATDEVKPPEGSTLKLDTVTAGASLTFLDLPKSGGLSRGDIARILVSFNKTPDPLTADDFALDSKLSFIGLKAITDQQYQLEVRVDGEVGDQLNVQLREGWLAGLGPAESLSLKVIPRLFDFDATGSRSFAFEGANSSIVALSDGSKALRVVKPSATAMPYAGVTVGTGTESMLGVGTIPIDAANSEISVWVYAPKAGIPMRMQLASSDAGQVRRYLLDSEMMIRDDRGFVEAETTTTSAGWQKLTFDFNTPAKRFVAVYGESIAISLDPKVRYDQISLFPDFNNNPDDTVYYFDNISFGDTAGLKPADPLTPSGPGPITGGFTSLDFESLTVDTVLPSWDGAYASVVVDPSNTNNQVVRYVEAPSPRFYAGATLGSESIGSGEGEDYIVDSIPFDAATGKTLMSARIWSDAEGVGRVVRMQVADSSGESDANYVHAEATITQAGWNTLTFDFSKPAMRWVEALGKEAKPPLAAGVEYDKISVYVDWNNGRGADGQAAVGTVPATERTYYIDDIRFVDSPQYIPADPIPAGYVLAFRDEFTTNGTPDANIWRFDLGDGSKKDIPGWGNQEAQYYTKDADNVWVENGVLNIAARANDTATNTSDGANTFTTGITSARITTQGMNLAPYGYVEVRAKLPAEAGAWPAIWMLGEQGIWPASGEIDIVEWSGKYFNDKTVQAALHYPNDFGDTSTKEATYLTTSVEEWHKYQLWWSPDEILIGVDGDQNTAYFSYEKAPNAGPDDWPFDKSFYLLMNVAVGGVLGGNGYMTTLTPSSPYVMQVDYVRVYQAPATPTAPTAAPTAPTESAVNVKSLFSNTFTDAVSSTWSTSWDVVNGPDDVTLNGNTVKKYTGLNFIGIEPAQTLDASDMDTFHIDVWRTDPSADFKIKLVDFGPNGVWNGGGDDKEHEIIFNTTNGNAIATHQWVSLDIPMSQFTGLTTREHIAQLILASTNSAGGSGESLWIDNVYFSKAPVTTPTAPTAAPTAPTESAANVKSLFSNTFTDAVSSTWSTSWDVVTGPDDVTLNGNTVKKYTGLNFIGIEPAQTLNIADMDTFHIDVWRTDSSADFKIKLVDFGANGVWGTNSPDGDNVEHEIVFNAANGNAIATHQWVSLDIPLSQFTGLTTREHIAQLILASATSSGGSGESLWIDNVYFSTAVIPV
ncbi:MAG: hypothetical protein RI906_1324 [Pseudomonadota bacterium]